VELTIRHLTGSSAGQVQVLNSPSITLGRNPTNHVSFDPEADRMVSGLHAELNFHEGTWTIRDLGSSNGTFIGDQQISERLVRSGEIIQLGKKGPKLQLEYSSSNVPYAVSPAALNAPAEGRTVVMMMQEGGTGGTPQAGAAAGYTPGAVSRKKKSPLLRVLLVVGLLFAILFVLGIGGIVMLRRRSANSEPVPTAAQKKAAEEAAVISKQIEAKKSEIAQTQATLQKAQQAGAVAGTGTTAPADAADMQRQLQESQYMIEELTRQLQEKNDLARPAQPASRSQSVGPGPYDEERVARQELARRVAAQAAANRAATAQRQSPPSKTTVARVVPTPATAIATPAPPAVVLNLSTAKRLKKRVKIEALPSEGEFANLPGGAGRDIVNLITTALSSTGTFLPDNKGGVASVSVAVSNYRNDVKTSVDTAKAGSAVSAVGGLFGQSVPTVPVNVTSGTMNAELSIRVRVYDSGANQVAEVQPAAASFSRKTTGNVSGLSLGRAAAQEDSPVADVTRQVVAEAVDAILAELQQREWRAVILEQKADGSIIIDCGFACGVENGDVFDVVGGGQSSGRIRVTFVDDTTSTAEQLAGGKNLKGKSLRYAGREGDSPGTAQSRRERTLQLRSKSAAFKGPGKSFGEAAKLKAGTRLRYLYSVGLWAKGTDGKRTLWVPINVAQITG